MALETKNSDFFVIKKIGEVLRNLKNRIKFSATSTEAQAPGFLVYFCRHTQSAAVLILLSGKIYLQIEKSAQNLIAFCSCSESGL